MERFSRLALVGGRSVATMVLAGAAGGVFVAAAPAQAATVFPLDGTDSSRGFSLVLLADTCSITVDARGADGGSSLNRVGTRRAGVTARDPGGAPGVGGKGGHVIATFSTSAGDILELSIGGRGGDDSAAPNVTAGSPGETGGIATGGSGGADTAAGDPLYVAAGGGGMSRVELNGAIAVVAAGGGGASLITDGGNGGSPGTAGADDEGATGGGGGTNSSGGSAGSSGASNGGYGTGGNGASIGSIPGVGYQSAGGGGGAGVYGGGGGGNDSPNNGGAAGGGGANFVASGATAVTDTTGLGGSGYVQVTLNACAPPAGAPTNLTAVDGDQAATLSFGAAPDNGGTITGYELSLDGGGAWVTFPTSDNGDGTRTGTKTGLTAKTTYHFKVRARGSGGAGAPSTQLDYIAATVPSVLAVTATPGDSKIILTFPAADGMGRPVLRYQWRIGSSGPWTTLADSAAGGGNRTGTVTGLANGVSTLIQVRAVNVIGNGAFGPGTTVTPQVPTPLAPTGLTAAPGNGRAQPTFTPPADNGGGTVLRYEYQLDGTGTWTTFTTTDAGNGKLGGTVPGLSNGVTYAVRVRAVNGQGAGAQAGPALVTPAAVFPGAPAITGHQLADGSATLTYTAPADNGSATITSYEVQLDNGLNWNTSGSGSDLTAMLTPLTAGTTYNVRVRAVNGSGPGTPSAVETFVAVSVPDAPDDLTAVGIDGGVVTAFTPPAANGGVISSYMISFDGGTNWTTWYPPAAGDGKLGGLIAGLTNGNTYDLRVLAVNQYGSGPPSATATATPHLMPPGPPVIGFGTPGDRSVTLTFIVPDYSGSSAITGYDVSMNDGDSWTTVVVAGTGPFHTATLPGLTVGTTYPIRVRARNTQGAGEQSAAYAFTASGVPAAPTITSAEPRDALALLNFTAGNENGSSVWNYEVTLDDGVTWTGLPTGDGPDGPIAVVSALVNGTQYTVKMRAVNSIGPGVWSNGVTVTPVGGPPGPPTGLTVAARDGGLLLRFTPPAGVSGPTYQTSTDNGVTWSDQAVTPAGGALTGLITGLTNGTTYAVQVRAVDGDVTGYSTGAVAGTPLALAPAPAPTSVTAVAGTSSVTVSWPASTGDGAEVTGYTVTASPGPATCETTTELSCVLGGEAGVAYTYSVVAHSASGDAPTAAESQPVTPAMPEPPAVPPAGAFELTTTDGAITTAGPGQEITFVGTGFAAFSTVVVSLYSDPVVLSTVVTGAGGAFRRTIIVPADLTAGTHTILAQGVDVDGNPRFLSLAVTVADDDTTTSGRPALTPALPTTGGTPWMVALLLIFFGAILRTLPSVRRA